MSARTQNVLMIIKISMIAMLIAALFFPGIYHPVSTTQAAVLPESSWMQYIKSFGLCLVAASFTYGGYQQTINFGNDVQNPSRNIPRASLLALPLFIILYLSVQFSYYKIIGFDNLKTTNEIASVIATRMFGNTGAQVFSGLLFLSVLAYVNVLLMSNPRVMYAMSDDGVLPGIFKKKSEKKEVLVTSLTVFAAVCIIVLFFAKTFNEILSFTIFLDSFGMAYLQALYLCYVNARVTSMATGIFSMKLFPLQPVIFICAYVFVAISIAIDKPATALTRAGSAGCLYDPLFSHASENPVKTCHVICLKWTYPS